MSIVLGLLDTPWYFSLVGKIPDSIDLLQIQLKGELIKGALVFNIFVEISSWPEDPFIFKELIFSISLVDISLNFKIYVIGLISNSVDFC
jgi:hypothetical protein